MQHRQEPIDRHLLSPSGLGLLHVGSGQVTVVRGWRWVWRHRCHVMWLMLGLGVWLVCGWLKGKRKALASIASVISGSGSASQTHGYRVWCEVRRGLLQPEGLNARGLREDEVEFLGEIFGCCFWGLVVEEDPELVASGDSTPAAVGISRRTDA